MTRIDRAEIVGAHSTRRTGCAYVGGGFRLEVVLRGAPAVCDGLHYGFMLAWLDLKPPVKLLQSWT